MQDIAIATGAQFISEDVGLNLADAELDVLGTAE
jgi:chaperonin GroEL (HSP60 family)